MNIDLLLIVMVMLLGYLLFLFDVYLYGSKPTYRQRANRRKFKRHIRGIKREGENILLPFAFGLLIITIVALAIINLG